MIIIAIFQLLTHGKFFKQIAEQKTIEFNKYGCDFA